MGTAGHGSGPNVWQPQLTVNRKDFCFENYHKDPADKSAGPNPESPQPQPQQLQLDQEAGQIAVREFFEEHTRTAE
jgi:hypothetical protein